MCAPALFGSEIEGTVVIQRKLTKRRVTAPTSAYQRGVAVELRGDAPTGDLAFERERVVIYLEGRRPSNPLTATMDQKNRRFVPDTLVIPAGSTVSFPNFDPIFHNVFSLSKPKSFDLGNYPRNQTRTVQFPKPGVVFVNCHLHPNMGAVIVVTPNEWNTKAARDGSFRLTGVPPGNYTIVAWHKAASFFRKQVQVTAQHGAAVEFQIPLAEDGSVLARR